MAKVSRQDQYADALNQLDRMHGAGSIGDNAYALKRQELMAEAARRPRSRVLTFVGGLGIGMFALLILAVLLRLLNS